MSSCKHRCTVWVAEHETVHVQKTEQCESIYTTVRYLTTDCDSIACLEHYNIE